jgi:hypothetical protein
MWGSAQGDPDRATQKPAHALTDYHSPEAWECRQPLRKHEKIVAYLARIVPVMGFMGKWGRYSFWQLILLVLKQTSFVG